MKTAKNDWNLGWHVLEQLSPETWPLGVVPQPTGALRKCSAYHKDWPDPQQTNATATNSEKTVYTAPPKQSQNGVWKKLFRQHQKLPGAHQDLRVVLGVGV